VNNQWRSRGLGGPRVGLAAIFAVMLILFSSQQVLRGYSLLTHEQIIDIAWKDDICPVLLARFPGATAEQLRKAHAYAYGGCLIQDIGYYPFSDRFFTDLSHYVRSGDFIRNLLRESQDLNQYAFALGAMAHYTSDNSAHPFVNRAVALSFPKLRARYGDSVIYVHDPKAHLRVEFGFDLVQVAKNRYTSDAYHDFIGFEVSKPLLERAVFKTYGLHLDEVLGPPDLALGTFRRSVSLFIPAITHIALEERRPELVKEVPNFNAKKFRYNLSRAEYEREWGKQYRRRGPVSRFLAFLVRWVPKVGPMKALAYKNPTPETEDLYFKSVNETVANYRKLLHQVRDGHLDIANRDCDTGETVAPGEYLLTDRTYGELVNEHAKRNFARITPELRENILAYYAGAYRAPSPASKDRKSWRDTLVDLKVIETFPADVLASGAITNDMNLKAIKQKQLLVGAHGH